MASAVAVRRRLRLVAGKAKAPAKSPAAGKADAAALDANNWDQRLGFIMHDVSRLRRVAFDDFMKPFGATRSQWWVLAYLSRHDGMSQSDLAGMLDLGKAALGGLLDRLESAGFVERHADAADRRVKRVHLAAKGLTLVKVMRHRSQDMSERILQGLDDKQRNTLVANLLLVKKNLLSINRKES